jgi:hypothetical protein
VPRWQSCNSFGLTGGQFYPVLREEIFTEALGRSYFVPTLRIVCEINHF